MIKKNIFCIALMHISSLTMSMETVEEKKIIEVLGRMESTTTDIKKVLASTISGGKQWWYLHKTTQQITPQNIPQIAQLLNDLDINNQLSICFNPPQRPLIIAGQKINVPILDQSNNIVAIPSFATDENGFLQCFDLAQKRLAIINPTGICLRDTNDKITAIPITLGNVSRASFDNSGNQLAVASEDGKVHILTINASVLAASHADIGREVLALNFDSTGKQLAIGSKERVDIISIDTPHKIISFPHPNIVLAVWFSPCGKQLATGTHGQARIFDIKTQQEIASFSNPYGVASICFDSINNFLATMSTDHIMRTFTRHDAWTFEQLSLKQLLNQWLLIEKPDRGINTSDILLTDIASKFALKKEYLENIWQQLPDLMQYALWQTMKYKIDKYGKKSSTQKRDTKKTMPTTPVVKITQKNECAIC